MRYVRAKYELYQDEMAFRVYITDTLYYKNENKGLNIRYIDMIKPHEVDNRSGDEIALDVINRLNLRMEKDESS